MAANPVTHVSTFDGAALGWTLAGPERFPAGIWLEEATTNLLVNPSAEAATLANWNATSGASISKDTAEFLVGAASAKIVTPGSFIGEGAFTSSVSGIGTTTARTFIGSVSAWGSGNFRLYVDCLYGDASSDAATDQNITLSAAKDRFATNLLTVNAAKTLSQLRLLMRTRGAEQALTAHEDAAQIEEKTYATSFAYGDMGTGYAFTGTAHASTSTRAASSASISPSGILAPGSGALAFRITPTIETGLEEIWGECGVKGSGTDHLRWGRDASKHPFVEWSSNDAAYQRLTATETLTAGTAYDLYLGHTGTVTSLAVDAGTLQTGTRAAVSGDFSTGDLTLEASAGGVIYQPFATFSRTLTAKEIATLNGKNNWTMKVLAGNPYINFQLRPY